MVLIGDKYDRYLKGVKYRSILPYYIPAVSTQRVYLAREVAVRCAIRAAVRKIRVSIASVFRHHLWSE